MNDEAEMVRLFSGGPLVLLLLVSCLAVVVLTAALMRRAGAPMILVERAARRLERGRLVPTLWGLSAGMLVVVLSGSLLDKGELALLGVMIAAVGLVCAGLGVGAAGLAFGRDIFTALGSEDPEPACCLRLGLGALFCAVFLPVIGWLLVGLVLAAGIGAVLEAALVRRPSEPLSL